MAGTSVTSAEMAVAAGEWVCTMAPTPVPAAPVAAYTARCSGSSLDGASGACTGSPSSRCTPTSCADSAA
jgi:hypothetical protein